MKQEKSKWKRFSKPYHFLIKAGEDPSSRLAEVFKNFQLDDFREELNFWQELALCNDQSVYDEGPAREDLVDFVKGLHRLIEAFHIINTRRNTKKENKQLKQAKKMFSDINNPVLLTTEERSTPDSVIKHFCETFKESYAKIETLDLLDAVLTYRGNKKVSKINLILFYQHVHYLIKLAYRMSKK